MFRQISLHVVLCYSLITAHASLAFASLPLSLYWSECDQSGGRIRRSDLNGNNRTTLVSTQNKCARSLTIDEASGRIFWTYPDDVIYSTPLDGSGQVTLISGYPTRDGEYAYQTVDFGPTSNKMYWLENFYSETFVVRATPYQNDREILTHEGAGDTSSLVVQESRNRLYYWEWTRLSPQAPRVRIKKVDLQTRVQSSIWQSAVIEKFAGMVINEAEDKLIWAGDVSGTGFIRTISVNGGNIQTLAALPTGAVPRGLEIDQVNHSLYWIEDGTDRIVRAGLDGSNATPIVTGIDAYAITIGPIPEPSTAILLSLGIALLRRRRPRPRTDRTC